LSSYWCFVIAPRRFRRSRRAHGGSGRGDAQCGVSCPPHLIPKELETGPQARAVPAPGEAELARLRRPHSAARCHITRPPIPRLSVAHRGSGERPAWCRAITSPQPLAPGSTLLDCVQVRSRSCCRVPRQGQARSRSGPEAEPRHESRAEVLSRRRVEPVGRTIKGKCRVQAWLTHRARWYQSHYYYYNDGSMPGSPQVPSPRTSVSAPTSWRPAASRRHDAGEPGVIQRRSAHGSVDEAAGASLHNVAVRYPPVQLVELVGL
jgi:hypothetical protein